MPARPLLVIRCCVALAALYAVRPLPILAAEAAEAAEERAAAAPLEPAAAPPIGPEKELPAAFTKAVPESIDDLRAIETHVRALYPQLIRSTVGVRVGSAQGSGVIVTPDGFVLTAAHVSGRAGRTVEIVLPDGATAQAQTLGGNRTLDAGLMKIVGDRTDWPHSPLADLKEVEAGDWCIALGHPAGYQDERGLVLRLGRVIFSSTRLIQTDCELVGGDSGGPLFDMHGRVIGINSRIQRELTHNFHAPICAYGDDWARLTEGEVFDIHSGALLGLSGRPDEQGLKVTQVYEGEPAKEAGVAVGDILVTLQGKRVKDINQLIELVGGQDPGRKVKLELLRNGKPKTVTVELGMRWD